MKKILSNILYTMLVSCIVCACNDRLDITQDYTFDLQVLPYPARVIQGETVEIRCKLVKEGDYRDAKYFIRYFQTDGKGVLRLNDERVLTPNDLFELDNDVFRLYYTSHCTVRQKMDVYIVDGNGQTVQKTFTFENQPVEPEPAIDFNFEFETLPVPKSVIEGETVEIRCRIKRADSRNNTDFFIRYFQPDGKGELRFINDILLIPNDLYKLDNDIFRLYYTSRSADLQTIDIYIVDSFEKVVKKTLAFTGIPLIKPDDEPDPNDETEPDDESEPNDVSENETEETKNE